MQAINSPLKFNSVPAFFRVTYQASVVIRICNLRDPANISIRKITKVFHEKIITLVCTMSSHPLFASLEGLTFGGFNYFGGKSATVGMLTKIRVPKAHGVHACFGATHQAYAIISIIKLGNLTISSFWQILKFFHLNTLNFNFQDVKLQLFPFCVFRGKNNNCRSSVLRREKKCGRDADKDKNIHSSWRTCRIEGNYTSNCKV